MSPYAAHVCGCGVVKIRSRRSGPIPWCGETLDEKLPERCFLERLVVQHET